jgi:hypothetical protein
VLSEIQERPPLTQKMSTVGPTGGGGSVRDLGAPTINARNVDGTPLGGAVGDLGTLTINAKNVDGGPSFPRGGSSLLPGSERCVVNLHDYDRQKVILLIHPTFPMLGLAMANDP